MIDVDKLVAGRELDALIAEKVMGSSPTIYAHSFHIDPIFSDDNLWSCHPTYNKGDICGWEPIPFSTDISAAWQVVEKLIDKGFIFHFYPEIGKFACGFGLGSMSMSETASLAICRAALRVMEKS